MKYPDRAQMIKFLLSVTLLLSLQMIHAAPASEVSVEFASLTPKIPAIRTITPVFGPIGAVVKIKGKNFNPVAAKNKVFFNGKRAKVTAATSTSMKVLVPSKATTGKITIKRGNWIISSPKVFKVAAPVVKPQITGFKPSWGRVGSEVVITGVNFDPAAAGNIVRINGIKATLKSVTTTSLTALVPAGATSGVISVEARKQTVTSKTPFSILTSGALDPGFGTAGAIAISPSNAGEIPEVLVQKSGRIVVVSTVYSDDTGNGQICLKGFKPDGTVDPSFGTGGKVTTTYTSFEDPQAGGATLQQDGKILVAGFLQDPIGRRRGILLRYLPDGLPDPAFGPVIGHFGTDGLYPKPEVAQSVEGLFIDVEVQSDGKIVVSGSRYAIIFSDGQLRPARSDAAIARYTDTGILDSTFGFGGNVITGSTLGWETFPDVAIHSNDGVVASGYSLSGSISYITRPMLYRLPPNGVSTAYSKGRVDPVGISYTEDHASISQAVIRPTGELLVAGAPSYDYDGIVDGYPFKIVEYGSTGLETTKSIPIDIDNTGSAFVLAQQADGKTVVATTSGTSFMIVRHHPDLSLDNSFGNGGIVYTDVGPYAPDSVSSIAIQDDGKIVLAGTTANGDVVLRYLP